MNDPDQSVIWSRGDELPERLWAYNETTPDEERSAADLTGGLVNLGFFTAALRRSAWVWCLTAVVGLLIGSALYQKYPPAYHATTTVLLVDNPSQNPAVEVQTDLSLAQSQAVAARVVQELRLPQSVASFQAAYTVTTVTDTSADVQRRSAVQRRCDAASIGPGYSLSPVPCPVCADPGAAAVRSARSAVQRGPATPPVD